MLTGESPRPVEAWNDRVAGGNCVAARRGGEQPEANNPAQNSISMRLNSIRPVPTRRARVGQEKPVTPVMSVAPPKHVKAATMERGKVVGVSGVGRCHWISLEACAGADREPRRIQSPRSSEESPLRRDGAKGGRKVNA